MKFHRFVRSCFSILLVTAIMLTATVFIPEKKVYAAGTVYYVDAVGGSDANTGTSESTPWKSLVKVSNKTNYQPGDQILFKAGCILTGTLKLKNSGTVGNPIVVGKYGTGAKPVINGNGGLAAINLENIQYITLQDLELTNFNAANPTDYLTGYYRRSGIWIKAYHNGPMKGITIWNMDIHDVTGMSLTGESTVTTSDGGSSGVNKNSNAAIQMDVWEWDTSKPKAYYDGLVIENNTIHDVSTIGISIGAFSRDPAYYNRNVIVRGNSVINNGADGIVVGGTSNPLVEYNASLDAGGHGWGYKWIAGMWCWKTDRATFQYNEVGRVHAEAKTDTDSAAFDTDISTSGDHIYQYNYSHDNEGGFFMDMGQLKNGQNIVRYNISQNDKRNAFHSTQLNITDKGLFYNNVFYNDIGTGFQMKNNANATFVNNIFYITGAPNELYASSPRFYYNAFYGQTAPVQGKNNLSGDPGFMDPGKGTDGRSNLLGYQLRPDSPLIGAGKYVSGNGGKDFFNNTLYAGNPDIGVFEDPAGTVGDVQPPAKLTAVTVRNVTDTTVTLTWDASEEGVPLDAEIYNAATNQLVATTFMNNECIVNGLASGTDYSFYVKVRDRAGNLSEASDSVSARTLTAVVVDNSSAVLTGSWTAVSGSSSYSNNYLKISAGSGTNSVKWIPAIPAGGYYSIYYYLPDGSASRATNAKFTVSGEGGTKTYSVDERPTGGQWLLLGIHRFSQGTAGYVQLNDAANGEVTADAIKFIYNESFGLDDIVTIKAITDKLQLRLGESTNIHVYGYDTEGKSLDLTADGAEIDYVVENQNVVSVSGGAITAVSSGRTGITANCIFNGNTLTSNRTEVIAGPQFTISELIFSDEDGNVLPSLMPGIVNTSVTIINSTEEQKRAVLIVTLYSPKGLEQYRTQQTVVNKYGNCTLSVQLSTPANCDGYYIKAFLWDSMATVRPYMDAEVFR